MMTKNEKAYQQIKNTGKMVANMYEGRSYIEIWHVNNTRYVIRFQRNAIKITETVRMTDKMLNEVEKALA